MSNRDERDCLHATIDELRRHGYDNIEYSRPGRKHWRVKAEGLPPIFCAATPSDHQAPHAARRTVRKIIMQST